MKLMQLIALCVLSVTSFDAPAQTVEQVPCPSYTAPLFIATKPGICYNLGDLAQYAGMTVTLPYRPCPARNPKSHATFGWQDTYFYALSVPGIVGYSVVETEVARYVITAAGSQVLADRVETTWIHTNKFSGNVIAGSRCGYLITITAIGAAA